MSVTPVYLSICPTCRAVVAVDGGDGPAPQAVRVRCPSGHEFDATSAIAWGTFQEATGFFRMPLGAAIRTAAPVLAQSDAERETRISFLASTAKCGSGISKVVCPLCGRSMSGEYNLKRHLTRSHWDEIPAADADGLSARVRAKLSHGQRGGA